MNRNVVDSAINLLPGYGNFGIESQLYIFYSLFDTYMDPWDTGEKAKCNSKSEELDKMWCKIEHTLKDIKEYITDFHVDIEKTLDYLIYWFYGQLNKIDHNVNNINSFHSKVTSYFNTKFPELKDKLNKKYIKSYNIKVLQNKKELYDFLNYYKYIKGMLNQNRNNQKFCNYIEYIFKLYMEIHDDYNSMNSGWYDDEIKLFKDKFSDVAKEINLLVAKCPLINLNLIFDKNNKSIRLIEQEKSKKKVEKTFESIKTISEGISLENTTLNKFYSELNECAREGKDIAGCNSSNENYIKNDKDFCAMWEKMNKILGEWKEKFVKSFDLSRNKRCDYLSYWLYEKVKKFKDTSNIIPFLYEVRELFIKHKFCNSKKYDFRVDQMENKKILFDFVENFNDIKVKLNVTDIKEKEKYCNYIKFFFDVYKKMETSTNGSKGYQDEMNYFQAKFLGNIKELDNLNIKCPGKCLKFIFTDEYTNFCTSEQESREVVQKEKTRCTPMNNFEVILIDSNLKDLYEELNKEDQIDNYKNYCTELEKHECTHPGVTTLCTKAVKNLIYLSLMPQNEERDERCFSLKHWLYQEIRKIFNRKSTNVSYEPVITKLKDVVLRINNTHFSGKPCYCSFDGTLNEWKEQKYLHDYFKSFDSIESFINKDQDACIKHFGSVNYTNKLYEKYIGECCYCFKSGHCKEWCPDYFKCEDTLNPYNLYLKLKCTEEHAKDFTIVDKPISIDNHVITTTRNSLLLAYQNKLQDPFYSTVLYAFGTLGIFMIFFVFYKFTPFGSLFHRKKHNDRERMQNFISEYYGELTANESEHENVSRNRRKIQLAYNSA
ncbi:PIR protein [Plasmodium vivax]|uniref:VIR protein n=1 Tax=Plasmodium vivax TaxID=5855 RepID=A0A564ZRX9_PLAVI|nr:PIR protein [Plasmodium vivax]